MVLQDNYCTDCYARDTWERWCIVESEKETKSGGIIIRGKGSVSRCRFPRVLFAAGPSPEPRIPPQVATFPRLEVEGFLAAPSAGAKAGPCCHTVSPLSTLCLPHMVVQRGWEQNSSWSILCSIQGLLRTSTGSFTERIVHYFTSFSDC